MKKFLILLAIPLLAAACAGQQTSTQNQTNQATPQNSVQGRAVFSITDAANATADMQNVTAVNLTIDKVEILGSSQSWLTVSTAAKTFNLLELKASNTSRILADAQIPAGTYNQVRLHVNKVVVIKSGVETEAKLPSNDLKIVGKLVVKQGETASMNLDFQIDKSLHLTGNGRFILTPVIKIESKSSADVEVNGNVIKVKSGKEEENTTVGSDENGEFKTNFELNGNVKMDVTGNGAIHITDKTETGVKITSDKAISIAQDGGKIDIAISVKLETKDSVKVWHVVGNKGLVLVNVYVNAQTGAVVSTN